MTKRNKKKLQTDFDMLMFPSATSQCTITTLSNNKIDPPLTDTSKNQSSTNFASKSTDNAVVSPKKSQTKDIENNNPYTPTTGTTRISKTLSSIPTDQKVTHVSKINESIGFIPQKLICADLPSSQRINMLAKGQTNATSKPSKSLQPGSQLLSSKHGPQYDTITTKAGSSSDRINSLVSEMKKKEKVAPKIQNLQFIPPKSNTSLSSKDRINQLVAKTNYHESSKIKPLLEIPNSHSLDTPNSSELDLGFTPSPRDTATSPASRIQEQIIKEMNSGTTKNTYYHMYRVEENFIDQNAPLGGYSKTEQRKNRSPFTRAPPSIDPSERDYARSTVSTSLIQTVNSLRLADGSSYSEDDHGAWEIGPILTYEEKEHLNTNDKTPENQKTPSGGNILLNNINNPLGALSSSSDATDSKFKKITCPNCKCTFDPSY